MAARETTRSWSGQTNPAWGLTTKVGPWKETPADLQKFNSRAGGPHAGHGNWMQSFNPNPYIQTMPTPGLPYYTTSDVVMREDFDVPRGMKIPGVNRAASKGITGKVDKLVDNLFSKYGIRGSNPQNGAQGNGVENLKEPKEKEKGFPSRILSRPIVMSPEKLLQIDIPDSNFNDINENINMPNSAKIASASSGKNSGKIENFHVPNPSISPKEPRQRGYGISPNAMLYDANGTVGMYMG